MDMDMATATAIVIRMEARKKATTNFYRFQIRKQRISLTEFGLFKNEFYGNNN